MGTYGEAALFVLILLTILFVAGLLLVLYQLWRAFKGINVTIDNLNEKLPRILQNVTELSDNANQSVKDIADFQAKVKEKLQALPTWYGLFGLLRSWGGRRGALSSGNFFLALLRAVRAFWQVWRESSLEKKECPPKTAPQ